MDFSTRESQVKAGVLIAALVLFAMWNFTSNDAPPVQRAPEAAPPVQRAPEAEESRLKIVTVEAGLCAASASDIVAAIRAGANGDLKGLSALLARGDVKSLEEGDKVTLLFQDGGLSKVRVESGHQLGLRCWIPTGFLK